MMVLTVALMTLIFLFCAPFDKLLNRHYSMVNKSLKHALSSVLERFIVLSNENTQMSKVFLCFTSSDNGGEKRGFLRPRKQNIVSG
jgi:hypothetical protein